MEILNMYLQICDSMEAFKSLHKTIFVLIQWITSPQGKTASVPKQAYMNSWPRWQKPAVVLPGHCSALLVLSPAQAILPSPFSSTFIVPSFH